MTYSQPPRPKPFNPRDFLLDRKFPPGKLHTVGLPEDEINARENARRQYSVELMMKSKLEIEEMMAAARKEDRQKEDEGRYFNRQDANADHQYWSRAAYWKIDEAVALSIGKDPRKVSWQGLKSMTQISEFAADYEHLLDLANRAVTCKQLSEPVLPGVFIAWARRMGLPFPEELEEMVKARGGNILDWKTAYDDLLKLHNKSVEDSRAQLKEAYEHVDAAYKIVKDYEGLCVKLREKIAELEKNEASEAAPLKTRERETLLKLVIGMAAGFYGYDPSALKNSSISEIVGDLAKVGISIHEDTVRKWLKEAAELLPREPQKT